MTYRALILCACLLLAGAGLVSAAGLENELATLDSLKTLGGPDVHYMTETGELARAQRCASNDLSPELRAQVQQQISDYLELNNVSAEMSVSIPVAFHVVYKTQRGQTIGNVPQSQIDAQISVLNNAFAGTGFSFTLASVSRTNSRKWHDRCASSRQELEMKQALAVDPATHLNFYTCGLGGSLLGYAYLPSSLPESDVRHGVVVLYSSLPGGTASPYNLGDTGTHEVGHYLGLEHTFANGCSSPGDFVADTPYEASPAYGCPVGRDSCSSAGLDPIFNFMDYTDDACMDEFTADQTTRMHNQVATFKPSL